MHSTGITLTVGCRRTGSKQKASCGLDTRVKGMRNLRHRSWSERIAYFIYLAGRPRLQQRHIGLGSLPETSPTFLLPFYSPHFIFSSALVWRVSGLLQSQYGLWSMDRGEWRQWGSTLGDDCLPQYANIQPSRSCMPSGDFILPGVPQTLAWG